MVAHVTILTTAGETLSIGREVQSVDGTETSVHLSELVVKNYAVELDLEATSASGGLGCVLGIDATSKHAVEFLKVLVVKEWADSDSSAWLSAIAILTDDLKSLRVEQLGSSVSGSSEKHGVVVGQEELEDLLSVHLLVLKEHSAVHVDRVKKSCVRR